MTEKAQKGYGHYPPQCETWITHRLGGKFNAAVATGIREPRINDVRGRGATSSGALATVLGKNQRARSNPLVYGSGSACFRLRVNASPGASLLAHLCYLRPLPHGSVPRRRPPAASHAGVVAGRPGAPTHRQSPTIVPPAARSPLLTEILHQHHFRARMFALRVKKELAIRGHVKSRRRPPRKGTN